MVIVFGTGPVCLGMNDPVLQNPTQARVSVSGALWVLVRPRAVLPMSAMLLMSGYMTAGGLVSLMNPELCTFSSGCLGLGTLECDPWRGGLTLGLVLRASALGHRPSNGPDALPVDHYCRSDRARTSAAAAAPPRQDDGAGTSGRSDLRRAAADAQGRH